ncbi:MAG: branched-chain amino acid ABC transporter permease LivH [Deltaproteobacteria bacterium]|jgi:branched-chain amino acid transport system permease protein|nr:branched-chain amino acid ABC transporter permease LivH [Deltaproteobacteria bacterium]
MTFFLDLFMSGLTKGSIYALIALGYTMVYGIIALINFAHGEIYMIGAFTALLASMVLSSPAVGMSGWGLLVSVATIAAVYAAMYGWTMERIAYRPLRGSSRLAPLISAIGMSIFLQNYVQLAQTPNFLQFPDLVPQMPFLKPIAGYLSRTQLVILLFTLLSMVGLTLFIKFTKTGMAMRAVAQDQTMARLTGVDIDRVISSTFVIGSVLAALGGVLIGCSMRQIDFYIGFLAGMKAFTAAVLGGIGSIPGAVVGALILGFAESFAAGYISSSYKDVVAFIILILILIFRPEGIMGQAQTQKV